MHLNRSPQHAQNPQKIEKTSKKFAKSSRDPRGRAVVVFLPKQGLVDNVLSYEQVPVPRVTNVYPVANYYVDITDYMDKKIQASQCHISQIEKYESYGIDMIDSLSVLARYRGNQVGVKYAEAFDVLKMVKK